MDEGERMALFLGFLVGLLIGVILVVSLDDSYKDGQLDFQRGKIKYMIAPDGTIWEKQKEKAE